jgi:DNA modification methylase
MQEIDRTTFIEFKLSGDIRHMCYLLKRSSYALEIANYKIQVLMEKLNYSEDDIIDNQTLIAHTKKEVDRFIFQTNKGEV